MKQLDPRTYEATHFTVVVAPDVAAAYTATVGPLPEGVVAADICAPGSILLVSRNTKVL